MRTDRVGALLQAVLTQEDHSLSASAGEDRIVAYVRLSHLKLEYRSLNNENRV